MCKALKQCREDVFPFSMEDRYQLGKELMGKIKAKSIT